MKNQSKDKSNVDEQLKQLDHDIIWKDARKKKLETKILFSMNREHHKMKVSSGFRYMLSIGAMVVLLFFIFHFLSDSILKQSEESQLGNHENQSINEKNIQEKESTENDKSQSGSNGLADNETKLLIQSGATETVSRQVEGMEQEVKVINYHIRPYGLIYQLDEVFGAPVVSENQIIYSYLNDEYKIRLEMVEHTNLEKAVSNLQQRFKTEGYEESFALENTPVEENHLKGKMQFFGHYPVKGFIAYEVDEHVLIITFQFPEEGGDGMYPILKDLRKSLHVQ